MRNCNDSPSENTQPEFHGNGLWTLAFPLRFFGMHLGRRVCIFRISGNRLVIHSTAPFTQGQIQGIKELGEPAIMLDATTMHDTFSRAACTAFPEVTYLVPAGFPRKATPDGTRSITQLFELTDGEIETVRLRGLRFLNEYACFHQPSRTLIMCDLVFNLTEATGWTRWSMKNLLGVDQWPAIDRPVRWSVTDKGALADSLGRIFQWDFDRVIVAHGSIIETDGKKKIRDAVERAGFQVSE